ncbi:hypothetical protein [Streptococcus sp. sy018]|uniref:hypothetical protein n=1 Tax=Streptococcus sp. sy018 TaxID=2600147 RepID=UPI0011B6054A|nr:hypothetical protein [Streptococcus sp. sy018]TWS95272.1 hypothetical protein FRX52_00265 [Streptococcus sp. sy018]
MDEKTLLKLLGFEEQIELKDILSKNLELKMICKGKFSISLRNKSTSNYQTLSFFQEILKYGIIRER